MLHTAQSPYPLLCRSSVSLKPKVKNTTQAELRANSGSSRSMRRSRQPSQTTQMQKPKTGLMHAQLLLKLRSGFQHRKSEKHLTCGLKPRGREEGDNKSCHGLASGLSLLSMVLKAQWGSENRYDKLGYFGGLHRDPSLPLSTIKLSLFARRSRWAPSPQMPIVEMRKADHLPGEKAQDFNRRYRDYIGIILL